MKKIKTICCECGILIHDGPTLNGAVSHGYCPRCQAIIIAILQGDEIDAELLSQNKTIGD